MQITRKYLDHVKSAKELSKVYEFKGHPRLVNVISRLYDTFLQRKKAIDPFEEVLITVGAYGALYCSIMGNVNDGDEVIIIEPYFDCYEPIVRQAGGTPKFISLKPKKVRIYS